MKIRKNKRKQFQIKGSNVVGKSPTRKDLINIEEAYLNKYTEFMQLTINDLKTIQEKDEMKGSYKKPLKTQF